jgi:hypothetical protein
MADNFHLAMQRSVFNQFQLVNSFWQRLCIVFRSKFLKTWFCQMVTFFLKVWMKFWKRLFLFLHSKSSKKVSKMAANIFQFAVFLSVLNYFWHELKSLKTERKNIGKFQSFKRVFGRHLGHQTPSWIWQNIISYEICPIDTQAQIKNQNVKMVHKNQFVSHFGIRHHFEDLVMQICRQEIDYCNIDYEQFQAKSIPKKSIFEEKID